MSWDSPNTRLAAYGTLRPGESNHHLLADVPGEWLEGTVEGVRFIADGYPAFKLKPGAGDVQVSVLTSATLPERWAWLDDFEGVAYRRIVVPVKLGGGAMLMANLYEYIGDVTPLMEGASTDPGTADVTSAEPEEKIHQPALAAAEPADAAVRTHGHRRWPWVVLLLLILAAILGMAIGVGVIQRGRSFGAQLPLDAAARPTFVIAVPPSPSPAPSSPRSAATLGVVATSTDEYTVAAGDTLRSIAAQVYGDPAQWPRIYDANRDTIGPDPDALIVGTRLAIRRP